VHYLVSLLVSVLYMAGLALSPSVGWVLVLGASWGCRLWQGARDGDYECGGCC